MLPHDDTDSSDVNSSGLGSKREYPKPLTTDARTNIMRQTYRQLDDAEKLSMQSVKELGEAFWEYLDELGQSRELSLAKTKIEEAVMWATKHITR